jgi:ATP synthase protein I
VPCAIIRIGIIIVEKTDGKRRMKEKPQPSVMRSLGAMGILGFTIAIPLVAGAIVGTYLDGLIHTKPLFILLGLLLGLISGIYGAYRLFKQVFQ